MNRYRKTEAQRDEAYTALYNWMRESNANGMSYDRIVAITGMSKTQVRRVCTAA